ncbi:hypothetical protein CSUI_002328 [Cystoisospora suis]|uniref:Uncharacterized protein n=1 Tax=Cystoisospora suis TaxID=483139 RepID=A0A2C6KUC5_9APIC|nr:hypothetical protein CSUI_002328 [Cystoisospora suis]
MEDLLTGGRGDDEVSSSVTGSRGELSGENKMKEGQVCLRKGEQHGEEDEEFSSRRGDQHISGSNEETEQQEAEKGGNVEKGTGYQKRVSLLLDLSDDQVGTLQTASNTRRASDQSSALSSNNDITPPRVIVSSALSPPPSVHRITQDAGVTRDLDRREEEEGQREKSLPYQKDQDSGCNRVSRERNTSLDDRSADVSRSASNHDRNACPTGGVAVSKPSVPPASNTTGTEDDEDMNELQTWIGSPKGGGGEEDTFFLLPPSISADKKGSGDGGLGTGSDHGEAFSPISSLGESELRSRRASSDEEEDDNDDKDNASSPRSLCLKDSREEVRGEARREQEEEEGQELIELKKDQEKQNEDKVRDIMSCKDGSPRDKEKKTNKDKASDQVDLIREERERRDETKGKKTSTSLLDSDLVQDSSSSSSSSSGIITVSPGRPPPPVLSSAPAESSSIGVHPSSSSGAKASPGGSLEGRVKSLQQRESKNNRSSQSKVGHPSSSAVSSSSSSSFDVSSSSRNHPDPADLDLTYTRTIDPSGVHRRGAHGAPQSHSSGYPSSSSSCPPPLHDGIYSLSSLSHSSTAPAPPLPPHHPYGTTGFHSSPAICSSSTNLSSHSSPATAPPAAPTASRYPSFPSAASPPSLARCSVRSFPQPGGASVSSDYADSLHHQHHTSSSSSRNQKYMQFFDQEKSEEDPSGGRLKGPSRSSLFSSSSSSDLLPRTHSASSSSSFSRQPLPNVDEGYSLSSSSSSSARSAVRGSVAPDIVDVVVDAGGGEMKRAGEGKGRSGREVRVGSLAAVAEAAVVGSSSSLQATQSLGERDDGRSRKEGGDTRTLKRYMLSGVTSGAEAEVASPLHYGDLQVLVDIDDTIRSSGGVTFLSVSLGGIDTQYERGSFYPGCFQFLLDLSTHGLRKDQKPLTLGVLTARIPQVPITADSILNRKLQETALRRGIRGWGIDCQNKVLYSTLNEWIFPSEKGKRKFENLLLLHAKLARTHPNIKYVWIGDTGEMDRHAGELMARQMPDKIKAIFLHYVGDHGGRGSAKQLPEDYYVNGVPIVFFRTYIRAARRSVDLGLLERKGLARTMVQAVLDLDAMHQTPSVSTKWRDIIFDVRDAETLVPLKGATLPPLVQIREILHRRITDIKAALQRFRAKKGIQPPSEQPSTTSPVTTLPSRGIHKQVSLSKEQREATVPPSLGGSTPSLPASALEHKIGHEGLALHDARHRGEAVVPPGLAVAAAVVQREDEQGRGRGTSSSLQEGQDILAPARVSTVPKDDTPTTGSVAGGESCHRWQGAPSTGALQAKSYQSDPEDDEESGWIEVRWQKETGNFPRRSSSERRESSWRGLHEEGSSGHPSEPYYRHLLTHPGGVSSDDTTGGRSVKDYRSEEERLHRSTSDSAASHGSGTMAYGRRSPGGDNEKLGERGEKEEEKRAGVREDHRRHKRAGREETRRGDRQRRDSCDRDSLLETWGREEPFREVEATGAAGAGRQGKSSKDVEKSSRRWKEDIELREVSARPPREGLWAEGEVKREEKEEGGDSIGGAHGKTGKDGKVERVEGERGKDGLKGDKEKKGSVESREGTEGRKAGWQERVVNEIMSVDSCNELPSAVSPESPPLSAVRTLNQVGGDVKHNIGLAGAGEGGKTRIDRNTNKSNNVVGEKDLLTGNLENDSIEGEQRTGEKGRDSLREKRPEQNSSVVDLL